MFRFKVGLSIKYSAPPYEVRTVQAYNEKDALSRVYSQLPEWLGYRYLSIIE